MRLRHVVEADLPVLFEHQRDPDAVTMAHFPPRDRDAFLLHWRTRVIGSPTSTPRTIDVDGEVAGHVVSWQPAEGPREIGYWLGRAYWGRGIASEAVETFLSSCETRRPLVAMVAAHNAASRRVLEKCGFVAMGEPVIGADGVGEVTLRLDRVRRYFIHAITTTRSPGSTSSPQRKPTHPVLSCARSAMRATRSSAARTSRSARRASTRLPRSSSR